MDIYKATKQQGTSKYILLATNSEVNICFCIYLNSETIWHKSHLFL